MDIGITLRYKSFELNKKYITTLDGLPVPAWELIGITFTGLRDTSIHTFYTEAKAIEAMRQWEATVKEAF
jgi:hypothetical protein